MLKFNNYKINMNDIKSKYILLRSLIMKYISPFSGFLQYCRQFFLHTENNINVQTLWKNKNK